MFINLIRKPMKQTLILVCSSDFGVETRMKRIQKKVINKTRNLRKIKSQNQMINRLWRKSKPRIKRLVKKHQKKKSQKKKR